MLPFLDEASQMAGESLITNGLLIKKREKEGDLLCDLSHPPTGRTRLAACGRPRFIGLLRTNIHPLPLNVAPRPLFIIHSFIFKRRAKFGSLYVCVWLYLRPTAHYY